MDAPQQELFIHSFIHCLGSVVQLDFLLMTVLCQLRALERPEKCLCLLTETQELTFVCVKNVRRLVLVSTRRRRKNTVQIKFSDLYLGLFGLCCVNDFALEQIFYLLQGVCFHTALCGTTMVLDTDRFGPGNRPYWEMKEGRVSSRYPDLLRTLSKVSTGPWPAEAIV